MRGWWISGLHASDFYFYLLYACLYTYMSGFFMELFIITVRPRGGFELQGGAARSHRTAPYRSCTMGPHRPAPHRTALSDSQTLISAPHSTALHRTILQTERPHHGSVLRHTVKRLRICYREQAWLSEYNHDNRVVRVPVISYLQSSQTSCWRPSRPQAEAASKTRFNAMTASAI